MRALNADRQKPSPSDGRKILCQRLNCDEPLSDERLELGAKFCSKRCGTIHHQRKSPAYQRHREDQPFARFLRATDVKRRLKVAETEHAQEQARKLIKAGMAAFENGRGLVRDLGVAREQKNAGRIYRKKAGSASQAASPPDTLSLQGGGDA